MTRPRRRADAGLDYRGAGGALTGGAFARASHRDRNRIGIWRGRLKGLKGPPSIKPSGMEQASGDAPPKDGRHKRRRRGRGAANLSVHEDRVVKVAVPANQWHTLRVEFIGTRFNVIFNGRPLFEVEDATFSDGGMVGLWTKADSITAFNAFAYGEKK